MYGTSAYSRVTFEICTRLAASGHKMAHIPMGYANKMGKQVYKDVLVYESGETPFSEDVVMGDYIEFKADMLITNKEPWVFQDIYKLALNYVPMAIIDHSPVSAAITSKITNAFKVITQSRFGQRELNRKNIDSVYIPLGVNTDVFKPIDKIESKKAFSLDSDDFVVGVVCMNRSRKMLPRMLRGFKRFLELNPDIKSKLMLWTNIMPNRPPAEQSMGVADVGVNLLPEIINLGLGDKVVWVKWSDVEKIGGLPDVDPNGTWDMLHLYNSFDVLLGTTGGEGAGLPYLEAAACGVSSIYTNYAAASEYAGPTGFPVNAEDYVIINTPGTRYYLADIDGIAEALKQAYDADKEKLAIRTRMFATQMDWQNIITDHWLPFLQSCEKELRPKITNAGISTW